MIQSLSDICSTFIEFFKTFNLKVENEIDVLTSLNKLKDKSKRKQWRAS